jgi:hypothetical protein
MPTLTATERRAAEKAENLGRMLCARAVDDLKADVKRGKRSRVWQIPTEVLVRAVSMHMVFGATVEDVHQELQREFVNAKGTPVKIPITNFRRWMAHARDNYNALRKQGWMASVSEDYIPEDGHVDAMAGSLAQAIYKHADAIMRGGVDGDPPTEKEFALAIRAMDQIKEMVAVQAAADRQRAQAQLDIMKADKLKRSLVDAMGHSPQASFSPGDVIKLIDGVLAGGVEVEEKILTTGGARGGMKGGAK